MGRPRIPLLALVLGAGLCLLLAILHNNGLLNPVEDTALRAAAPVQRGLRLVAEGAGSTLQAVPRLGAYAEENRQLQESVDLLQAELARLRQQARDDAELVAAANFAAAYPGFELTSANVVARDGSALHELLQIDRGSDSGLEIGMAVISTGGLVGRVVDVALGSARVLPINSPDSSVAVSVQGETEDVVGSVQGTGTALLEMDNVLLGDKITPGHFVVTSGLGSQIPRGILVGQIVKVRDRADIITRSADVRPAVNNDELKQVLVILAEVESQ